MLSRIRRSLALKLVLASALPSAAVLLVGLTVLVNYAQRLAYTDPALAFTTLREGALLGSAVALVFAATAIGLTTRRFLITPIRHLSRVMARAEGGEFLVRAKVDSEDDLGKLSRSFNTMLARVTDMAVHELETRQSLEQMEREVSLQRDLEEANRRMADHLRELELLLQVASALSGTLDLPEQLAQLGRHVCAGLGVTECSVLLLDDPSGDLVVEAVVGKEAYSKRGTRFRLGEGITGQVAARGETIYIPDVEADERFLHHKGRGRVTGSFVGVPLRAKGQLVGVMNLYRGRRSDFTAQEIRLAEAVASQAGLAIGNARLYAQTLELSYTDPLTGLPNRRALFQRLEQEWTRSLRFGDELSVVMLDLDRFKAINDAWGHIAGDVVLRGLALRLRRNVRKVDLVARYGGEEFCLVLPRIAKHEALEVAEKLRRAVANAPLHVIGDESLSVTISLGVASYGEDTSDVAALIEKADGALFEAKRAGRDRVVASGAAPRMVG